MGTTSTRDCLLSLGQNVKQMNDIKTIGNLEDILKKKTVTTDVEMSYQSFDTFTTLSAVYTEPTSGSATTAAQTPSLQVADSGVFAIGDTIIVQGNYGYEPDGTTLSQNQLLLYVIAIPDATHVQVRAVNGKKIDTITDCIPSMSRGCVLMKLGTATTNSANTYEQSDYNTNTITIPLQRFGFVLPEEDSKIKGVINSKTKVNSLEKLYLDQFIAYRDLSFIYGATGENNEVPTTTLGAWYQAGIEFPYGDEGFEIEDLIGMLLNVGSSSYKYGSTNKIILVSSCLLKYFYKYLQGNVIKTPIYTFTIVYFPTLDYFDNYAGLIVDPKNAYIAVKTPLCGNFDSDNQELTIVEESALVLEYPKTHCRIMMV